VIIGARNQPSGAADGFAELPPDRQCTHTDGREPDLRRDVHAAVGDPNRVLISRRLVAYRGQDPTVRQSGEATAPVGGICERGGASARWALVGAEWTAVLQDGACASSIRASEPAAHRANRGEPFTCIPAGVAFAVAAQNLAHCVAHSAHRSLSRSFDRASRLTAGGNGTGDVRSAGTQEGRTRGATLPVVGY